MKAFEITTREEGSIRVVRLAGEFDLNARTEFLERSRPAGRELLVVDLRQATFLDSHALGALIEVHEDTSRKRVSFAILRPKGLADRIFRLTGMDSHLPLFDDAVPLRAQFNYG